MEWIFLAIGAVIVFLTVFTVVFTRITMVRYSPVRLKKEEAKSDAFWANPKTELGRRYSQLRKSGEEWLAAQTPSEHTLTTFDGLKLKGWYYPAENARGTVILVHGYRSWATREFSFIAQYYNSINFNVFLYDRRAHGVSEGRYITFGVLDRFDLRDIAEYVDKFQDGALPMIIDGVSMGAATVCMASGLKLPENVKLLVADCPYTSPKEQIAHTMKMWFKLPKFPFLYIVSGVSKIIAGFGFSDCDSEVEMAKNTIPLFLSHGEADTFVPTYMGKRIYEACKVEKELFTVPEAGHAASYMLQTEEYQRRLRAFIDRVM